MLAAFKLLQKAKGARKALIFAPLRVCYHVWSHIGELGKWSDFSDLRVSLLHGKDKEKAIDADADLYVINYEGLPWLLPRVERLFKHGVDLLVIDELSKCKRHNTQRFKMFKSILGRFKRRWGLTGSPASNGLLDLWGEAYMLDLGKSLGRFITHFRCQYFYPSGYQGYEWLPQPDAEERIYKALKPLMLTMNDVDYLDLPDLVECNVWVDLPDAVRPKYDELEAEFITDLENGVVVASSAAVACGKLRQMASGGIYLHGEEKRVTHHLHDAKTEALQEIVEELQGQPVFIAFEFHHDLERMRRAFPNLPAIHGGTPEKECARLIAAWNAGELPMLAAHPAAVGHGLNLQGGSCANIVWYTPTFHFENYEQFNRRVYRQGNKAERVIVHRILARKTVDEAVARSIHSKDKTQRALFDALKEYARCK